MLQITLPSGHKKRYTNEEEKQTMTQVHVISENDLYHWKLSGKRIRAVCHFHWGSTRTLSIAPWYPDMDEDEAKLAGWGYCHNAGCHVTVLVKEWNPRAARRYTDEALETRPPRISATTDQMREAEQWQRDEVAALHKVYPAMQRALRTPRALAYLAQRGIEGELLDLAERLGVGYLPPADLWRTEPPMTLRKWLDRIIFPFKTSDGEIGYLGRTLQLWQEGMDEQEHKRVLDAHNEAIAEEYGKAEGYKQLMRRWEKTYRSGFFHAEVLSMGEHLTITEGPFDALPLLIAGLHDVVAVAGTHIEVEAIPTNILRVTIAFDSDTRGKEATDKLQKALARKGINTLLVPPPDDGKGKDWSERYRRYGQEGIASILAYAAARVSEQAPQVLDLPHVCAICGADQTVMVEMDFRYTPQGVLYCEEHYALWEQAEGAAESTVEGNDGTMSESATLS
jgi:Toprim domain-containing protein